MICDKCIHKKVCTVQLYKAVESCDRFEDKNDYAKVVRCKDCVFWEECGRCNGIENGLHYEYTEPTDYCSYGKRKEQ